MKNTIRPRTKEQIKKQDNLKCKLNQILVLIIFICIIIFALIFLFWNDLRTSEMDLEQLGGGERIEDIFENEQENNKLPPILIPPN
ncbi:MAG: hypothetical protein FWE13_05510 [Firmicutes bacterium]|nr:hypothetical protein [Bacillota bacterium]